MGKPEAARSKVPGRPALARRRVDVFQAENGRRVEIGSLYAFKPQFIDGGMFPSNSGLIPPSNQGRSRVD